MQAGVVFRPGSLWIGAHWSAWNRRLCVNVLPCVTLWITLRGGRVPLKKTGRVAQVREHQDHPPPP